MKPAQEEIESIKARKLENKEATVDEEDYLSRLPEELLIRILNKVSDLKSLCRCSVVSKHIASLIPHVTSITLTLPSTESSLVKIYKGISKSWTHNPEDFLQYRRGTMRGTKLPRFLAKFRGLESIFLEYICPRNNGANKLLRWKFKWSDTWTTLVALLPASVHKKTDPEPGHDQGHTIVLSLHQDCASLASSFSCEWFCTLCSIAKSHSSVRSVTITDSERRGILTARDEQLAVVRRKSYRNLFFVKPQDEEDRRRRSWYLNIGVVPFLELPLSGYLMRDVCLCITYTALDGDHQDYKDVLNWDFGGEEEVFGEAVKEILKNHRDRLWIM